MAPLGSSAGGSRVVLQRRGPGHSKILGARGRGQGDDGHDHSDTEAIVKNIDLTPLPPLWPRVERGSKAAAARPHSRTWRSPLRSVRREASGTAVVPYRLPSRRDTYWKTSSPDRETRVVPES